MKSAASKRNPAITYPAAGLANEAADVIRYLKTIRQQLADPYQHATLLDDITELLDEIREKASGNQATL